MEELIDGVAALKIVEERLHGNARANKHWRAAENIWVAMDDRWPGSHYHFLSIQLVVSLLRAQRRRWLDNRAHFL